MRAVSDPAKPRETVDVVVPFAGTAAALRDLRGRVERLDRGPSDTLTIVENRPADAPDAGVPDVMRAPERQSSYFARSQGARAGSAPWLLFLDADVDPPVDLVSSYFETPPDRRTAVLAGAVVDEPLEPGTPSAAATRFALLHASMSQSNTMLSG